MHNLESEYILSRFKESKLLSDSGENQVYMVLDTTSNRPYIQKVFPKDTNLDIYEQIQSLVPKNIPKIHHVIKGEANNFVIEEYISGTRLDELLGNKSKFDTRQVITWVLSLCDTLKQLHDNNPPIIHRDMKPSNIIITDDNIPKLIDFSISRNYKSRSNSDTNALGTEYYAAPEQYGFTQTDVRTDLFAIGRLMIVLLTGKQVDCSSETINLGKLKPIISKCCAIDPKDRYKDISQLMKALQFDLGVQGIASHDFSSDIEECFCAFNSNQKLAAQPLMKLYNTLIAVWRFNEDFNLDELYNLLECIYTLKICAGGDVYLLDKDELLDWAVQWFYQMNDKLISDWKNSSNSDFEKLLMICVLIKMLSTQNNYAGLIYNAEFVVYNVLGKTNRVQKVTTLYIEKHAHSRIGTYWYFSSFIMKQLLSLTQKLKRPPKHDGMDVGRWFYSNQLLDEKLFALQGAPDDTLHLAKYYLYGDSIPQSYHRALFWLNQAKEQGNAEAMYLAAIIYESPESPYHNIKQCLRWYEESATSDNPAAQFKMYEIYHEGIYVPRNEVTAKYWCELAAKQKHPEAISILGN